MGAEQEAVYGSVAEVGGLDSEERVLMVKDLASYLLEQCPNDSAIESIEALNTRADDVDNLYAHASTKAPRFAHEQADVFAWAVITAAKKRLGADFAQMYADRLSRARNVSRNRPARLPVRELELPE